MKELAGRSDCIIVDRSADAVLRELHPFTIFVYADMPSKIARCRSRAAEDEILTDREWERKIKQVDKARAENYSLLSSTAWDDLLGYHLCVNTSGTEIKSIVAMLANYAATWLERKSI